MISACHADGPGSIPGEGDFFFFFFFFFLITNVILELDDFHVVELIAHELAKWHSLDFPADRRPVLWDTLRRFAANGN